MPQAETTISRACCCQRIGECKKFILKQLIKVKHQLSIASGLSNIDPHESSSCCTCTTCNAGWGFCIGDWLKIQSISADGIPRWYLVFHLFSQVHLLIITNCSWYYLFYWPLANWVKSIALKTSDFVTSKVWTLLDWSEEPSTSRKAEWLHIANLTEN